MKIKHTLSALTYLLGAFFVFLSPYLILISSILSAVDYYMVSGVIAGVVGFFVGGTLATIAMTVLVLVLAGVGYYIGIEKEK